MVDLNYAKLPKISFEDWRYTDKCECGGPVFKYQDGQHNVWVVKCGHLKETLEIEPKTKKRVWVKTKKQPCGFCACHVGEEPVFVSKVIEKKKKVIKENPHKTLKKQLESLFTYLLIEVKDTFLQEIDLMVKYKLCRLPRQKNESILEYRNRIFSQQIIDKTCKRYIKYTKKMAESENFIQDPEFEGESDAGSDFNDDAESDSDDSDAVSDFNDSDIGSEVEDELDEEDIDVDADVDIPDETDDYDYGD
jgi:hypothetical protein